MKERRRLPTISADGGAVVAGAASPAAKPRAGSATAHCGGRSVRVLMSRRQRPADWRCRCSEPCRSSSTRFKTAHLTCQGSVARVHSQFASLRKHRISALGRVPGSYFEIISDPVELDRALKLKRHYTELLQNLANGMSWLHLQPDSRRNPPSTSTGRKSRYILAHVEHFHNFRGFCRAMTKTPLNLARR